MSNLDLLKTSFAEGLGIDPATVDWDKLAYRSIDEWDSVAHMQLVAEIEDSFDIMLETDDVIGMSSFPVTIDILTRYGVEFPG